MALLDWFRRKTEDKPPPVAPPPRFPSVGARMYSGAKADRLTASFRGNNSSADSELVASLTALRGRARTLVRDTPYAKRAKVLVVNNVIGSGIGLQSQARNLDGSLNKRAAAAIEDAWREWSRADSCHTGGRLAFAAFERAVMGQVFEAGECFVRVHRQPFGASRIPFALELIEAERLADEFASMYLLPEGGVEVRMGVEVDQFHRPIAYWIRTRHPSEARFNASRPEMVERVPASEMFHLAIVDRWPQTRGEPWLHAVARRLNDMDGYSEAEIVRARAQAVTPGAIETPEDLATLGERQDDGAVEMELEPGVYKRLLPGEKLVPGSVTAPNPALDPFMRYMLREVASGVGVSYESLSRDYSQSNYSSSRLALLDDRDLWRVLQTWFIDTFREPVFRQWLQAAVLARAVQAVPVDQYAIDPARFEAVRFKPRGWSWVDPTKEVEAYRQAVTAGFVTVSDVIAQTAGGADLEDVLEQRARELEQMEEAGLVFETSPEFYDKPEPAPAAAPAQASDGGDSGDAADEETDGEDGGQPARRLTVAR